MSVENLPIVENHAVFNCGHDDDTDLESVMYSLWNKIIDSEHKMWIEAEGPNVTIRGWVLGVERHYKDMVLEVSLAKKRYDSWLDHTGATTFHSKFIRVTYLNRAQRNCPGLMLLPTNDFSTTRSVDIKSDEYEKRCTALSSVSVYEFFSNAYSFRNFFHSRLFDEDYIKAIYHEFADITGSVPSSVATCDGFSRRKERLYAEYKKAKLVYEAAKAELQRCQQDMVYGGDEGVDSR
ncbi:hypothetical protein CYMTET_55080 [Cymbomonas tetramitiformis]|uniref:Uncharacterized protein n=1 Tax=Cymbomonas tetramitiformis TaxID=36881 RepID=A0AAE0BF64_9CHLO|nr:hypothetical protein CYMTET_55080 [Cymbomonas tetramitiformis]